MWLSILFFVVAGVLVAALLMTAEKFLQVKTDEKVSRVLEVLPGINCGACGFSGCEGYAAAVADGKAEPNLCKPGAGDVASKIGKVLGISVTEAERSVAFVYCQGSTENAHLKYDYDGDSSCRSRSKYFGGSKICPSGCEGGGDCVEACDFGAVCIVNGVAVVNPLLCEGCGKCAKACPKKIISMRKVSNETIVACSNTQIGKETRTACKKGCIACKMCEKKCPQQAITIENNKAVIDAEKCVNCGICVSVCPVKCIYSFKQVDAKSEIA